MNTRIRTQASIGMAQGLALAAIIGFLAIAIPAEARLFCGGQFEPPCPPPPIPPVCGSPSTAPCPATLLDTYFDTTAGDNIVRLIAPNASATNLCAMIYVFDNGEEMGACCGCALSQQKLLSLSVTNQLTDDWAIFGGPSAGEHQIGLIDVVSAAPNAPTATGTDSNGQGCTADQTRACNSGCDPTNFPGYSNAGQLKGYILHSLTPGSPEVPLAVAGDPNSTTLNYLQNQCGALVGNGTGAGICTCP
jgi:hypothetical protein